MKKQRDSSRKTNYKTVSFKTLVKKIKENPDADFSRPGVAERLLRD